MFVNGKKFTIGADPEVFIGDANTLKFRSAHDLLPGTKDNPYRVPNGAVQVDGMAAEFNIDPAEDLESFQENLSSVQQTLQQMIGDNKILNQTSAYFDQEFTKDIPPLNLMLGCDPDYNGWTCDENIKPEADSFMRTAGGHVHIGGFFAEDPFSPEHFETSARLARVLDETIGVYSLLWDEDDDRRTMYGQAGAFRPKTYGMEYRTLSNKWIFDPKLTSFVYRGVKRALGLMFEGYDPDEKVRYIINASDRGNAFFKGNPWTKQLEA